MSQDSSPFQDKNPFEVLGLQGTEDGPAIRKAFLDIATKSHPDRLRTKSEEVRAQALETFLLAKKAYEVLSQPDKRREWSERLARTKPASTPVPSPRPGPALTPTLRPVPIAAPPPRPGPAPTPAPELQRATTPPPRGTTVPSAMALHFYKQGLQALEASDYSKALDLISRAAKLSPTPRHQALELVCRGHQYLSTRFFDRARESFEQALRIQPDSREARAGLEAIEKQSARYRKGR
jgi:tetratricopeptide (TPR) repeat protein